MEQQNGTFAGMMRLKAIINLRGQQMMISAPCLLYTSDKGLQIYSAIDADNEIKDLFPVQEDLSFLSDDIQKLIEMKSTE